MPTTMASHHFPLYLLLLFPLFSVVFALKVFIKDSLMYPLSCSDKIQACNASLYHINEGFTKEEVAAYYNVNASSQIKPIMHGNREDYLITVPCSSSSMFGITEFFYNTNYTVKLNDTFVDVSAKYYSGQAWRFEEEDRYFKPDHNYTMHLLCGCPESDSQIVVTYTVQDHDTLSYITTLLSAKMENLLSLNQNLIQDPAFIVVGWVLFVPREKNGIKTSNTGECLRKEIMGFENNLEKRRSSLPSQMFACVCLYTCIYFE